MSYEIQQKWAFGMAPPKPDTSAARHRAARIVVNYLDDGVRDADLPSALSEIKGLFSRVWKQDQWDWFATSRSLGYPATVLCRKVSQELANARKALVDGDEQAEAERRALLRRLPVRVCLRVLLGTSRIADEPGAGWVYLLSRREEPDVLKIGMTTRTVEERVREINGSTGVLYPIGVRSCWRVRTPDVAERLIHQALAASRIRADREFFRMPFAEATRLISSTLRDNALELRTLDNLVAIQVVDNGREAALDGA